MPFDLDAARDRLEALLAQGMETTPLGHASQVAEIAGVLYEAFLDRGLQSTMVGGSAIEVHAPGIYKSGDIDLVIQAIRGADMAGRIVTVFTALGFTRHGRHWTRGDLFVEVPSHDLEDPHELMRVGHATVFDVVTKEAVLFRRVVGFKHWQTSAYGQQAIDMLSAFGEDLDMTWLEPALRREAAWDAFEALRRVAISGEPVTEASLQGVLDDLHGRPRVADARSRKPRRKR